MITSGEAIDPANAAPWDCNVLCALWAGDAARHVWPGDVADASMLNACGTDLTKLADTVYAAAVEDPSSESLREWLHSLTVVGAWFDDLENIDSPAVVESLATADAYVSTELARFVERYGEHHSVLGQHSADPVELFMICAGLLGMFVAQRPLGALSGIAAYIWSLAILGRFDIPLNIREHYQELRTVRWLCHEFVDAPDDELDYHFTRLTIHLFGRARLAAKRQADRAHR